MALFYNCNFLLSQLDERSFGQQLKNVLTNILNICMIGKLPTGSRRKNPSPLEQRRSTLDSENQFSAVCGF